MFVGCGFDVSHCEVIKGILSIVFQGIKGIVFDLDDTLCAYFQAVKTALPETFRVHISHVSVDSFYKTWVEQFHLFCPTIKKTDWYLLYLESGEPTRTELMRRALEVSGVKDIDLAKKLSQTYMENRDKALRLFPESLSVLEALKPRYRLGLLTNGPADIQRQEIATLGIEGFFDGIWIEGERKVGKPLKEAFDQVEREFGLSPEVIVMLGNDAGHDIYPAIERGWKTVWVDRPDSIPPGAGEGYEDKSRLKVDGPQPDLIVTDLNQFLKVLNLSQGD